LFKYYNPSPDLYFHSFLAYGASSVLIIVSATGTSTFASSFDSIYAACTTGTSGSAFVDTSGCAIATTSSVEA
jgi:hypothetical protein